MAELCPFNLYARYLCSRDDRVSCIQPFNVYAPKWRLAYFVLIDAILAKCSEIWTSHLFCPSLTLTLI